MVEILSCKKKKKFKKRFLTLGRDRGALTSKSIFNQGAPWYVLATDYHSLYADDVLNSPILKRVLVILFGGYKLAEVNCIPKFLLYVNPSRGIDIRHSMYHRKIISIKLPKSRDL